MWMMGCNDGGGFNMSTDTFNGRKLRPLIPRPSSSTSVTTPTSTVTTPTPTTYSNITSTTATTINSTSSNISTSHHHYHPHAPSPPPPPPPPSSCFKNLHHTEIFLLNNHLSMVSEQNKRDLQIGGSGTTSTTTTVVNSRWNPTPEQLRTLEELYRRGTRTPSADQIQHITAQLRRYGKIEGKNVFYWFQNHKARERQKRRRRSEYIDLEEKQQQQQQQFEIDLQRNESGSSRTVYEVQQTKNWSLPTNCSTTNTTLSQEPVSMQEAIAAVGAVESGMKTDGWIELEDRELQHNINNRGPPHPIDTHATWQMMNLSCSSSPHPNLNIFISSTPPPQNKERFYHQDKFDHQKSHTLELFPLRNIENNEEKINGGDHHHHLMIRKEITTHELLPVTTMNNNNSTTTTNFNTAPCKFFEFL